MSSEEQLGPHEVARLAELEQIIERAEKDRGLALREVHDRRLYRDQYKTFEQYCRQRWNITGQYGMQLIRHASINQTMVGLRPQNERQARELARLSPQQAETVMKKASQSGTRITAKKIKQARKEVVKTEPAKRYMPNPEEKRRRLDEEVRLWSEGYHRNDICKVLGISASTLNMDLASRGVSGRPVAGRKPMGHPMEVIEWRDQPEETDATVIRLKLVPGKAECDLDRETADRYLNQADVGSDALAQYIDNGYELTDSQVERLVMIRDRVDRVIRKLEQQKGVG